MMKKRMVFMLLSAGLVLGTALPETTAFAATVGMAEEGVTEEKPLSEEILSNVPAVDVDGVLSEQNAEPDGDASDENEDSVEEAFSDENEDSKEGALCEEGDASDEADEESEEAAPSEENAAFDEGASSGADEETEEDASSEENEESDEDAFFDEEEESDGDETSDEEDWQEEDSETDEEGFSWELDRKNGVLTISGTDWMDDFGEEGAPWYEDRALIKQVVIEDGVQSIGAGAFYGCKNLVTISIPDSVTWLSDHAFEDCRNLTDLSIPDSVTYIGDYCFAGCRNLTDINIPDSVTYIGESAFADCKNIAGIKVSGKNQVYDSRGNCNAIIETASNELILGCKNTVIPKSVTGIGQQAFYECEDLENICIPDSVTRIGEEAFAGCDDLTTIAIPDSVTDIWYGAFHACRNLTSLVLPDNGSLFNLSVFDGCSSLSTIYYEGSACDFESDYEWDLANTNVEFVYCREAHTITAWEDSGSYYCSECGRQCYSLDYSFAYDSETGDSTVQIETFNCNTRTPISVRIPEAIWGYKVTAIGAKAFANCSQITSITVPDSVTGIGHAAFSGCKALKNIVLPKNVTSLGEALCDGCESLKGITIKSGCALPDDCLEASHLGMLYNAGSGTYAVNPQATIYCAKGSPAEKYAKTNGIHYEYTAAALAHVWSTGTVRKSATYTEAGERYYECRTCGETKVESIPVKSKTALSECTVTLSATRMTYTGKALKPAVTVKIGKKTVAASAYKVSYTNHKKAGTATVKITAKSGNVPISGSVSKTFQIRPEGTSIVELTAGSRSFTIKWEKQTVQTSGYQIQYATWSDFSDAKTVTIRKNGIESRKIRKLKAGQGYYVRIRTFRTVAGKKYVSAWSAAATVTANA